MWDLDYKEIWVLKNWCFWAVVLEKTLESPLESREIKQVNLKGNKSWILIGRTGFEAETPVLWSPNAKNWLIGADPDSGKDLRWEEKGRSEDEMVRWHYWLMSMLNGHEFEQAPRVGDGQGSLVCCSPWGHRESDTTEWLNWTELFIFNIIFIIFRDFSLVLFLFLSFIYLSIFLDAVFSLISERHQLWLLYIFSRHFFYLNIFLAIFNAGRALQLSSYIVLTTLKQETPKFTNSSVPVMKIMVTSFKRSRACTATLSAPNPAAGHYRLTPPWRLLDTHRHGWVSCLLVTAPLSWVLVCTKFCLCTPRVYFPSSV